MNRVSRRYLVVGVALIVFLGGALGASAAPPDKDQSKGGPTWQSPECEVDGSPLAGTDYCTPNKPPKQPKPSPNSCDGSIFCEATYSEMEAAGFDTTAMRENDSTVPAIPGLPLDSGEAYYTAWLNFYLYDAPSHCNGSVEYGNHCGWLYHKYKRWYSYCPQAEAEALGVEPEAGCYLYFTTSYPARSGNNNPADEWVRSVGPIPNDYNWRWGYMNGTQTGYESRTSSSFYPGLWRLDPWVAGSRSAFEIHGGKNSNGTSRLWTTITYGCVRLSIEGINGLKSKWDNRTSNKTSAYLYIYY